MSLSRVRSMLEEARVRPVKTLGQNFLHDRNLARWIVDQAQIRSDDYVVEIGPGLGALTGEILSRGARLLALEKDARLVDFLRANFSAPNFEVRHGDALDFDTRILFAERNVKVIGNLPYYVASQLLLRFTEYPTPMSLVLLMLQDELARRLSAAPRTADYGALTLRVQLHHRVDYLRKIPATVFLPQPEVASAIVRLLPRDEGETETTNDKLFQEIVRTGFSQRRKQLRKLLSDRVSDWERTAEKIGATPTARAEELSREQWMKLTDFLAQQHKKEMRDGAQERFPVVDENDCKTGEATRAKVHANNLRHRAVHILVFNSDGEVLLQKRSAAKDRHPLSWDSSAAGHVEGDEAYEQTAVRELGEELGISARLEVIGKIPASEKTGHEFIEVYQAKCDGPFEFPAEEISAVKFFPVEIVEKWIANKPEEFAPGFLECWRMWRERTRAAP
jgi:16S rRNA (adenine1518-N6/adenine1519-N6)-dimethyltransferase